MAKYNSRVQGLISDEDKQKLEAIKKENSDISLRYIIEDFINDYCSTEPKGIKIQIKEVKNKIKKIENQMNNLHEDKIKLEIELKTLKDMTNNTLNHINNDLIKAVESVSNICKDKNINDFKDIPESTFIEIAKYNRINIETLKKEVIKLF